MTECLFRNVFSFVLFSSVFLFRINFFSYLYLLVVYQVVVSGEREQHMEQEWVLCVVNCLLGGWVGCLLVGSCRWWQMATALGQLRTQGLVAGGLYKNKSLPPKLFKNGCTTTVVQYSTLQYHRRTVQYSTVQYWRKIANSTGGTYVPFTGKHLKKFESWDLARVLHESSSLLATLNIASELHSSFHQKRSINTTIPDTGTDIFFIGDTIMCN